MFHNTLYHLANHKSAVNASPITVEPIPPVIYIRLVTIFFHKRLQASNIFSSLFKRANIAIPVHIYITRTACPSAVSCSKIAYDFDNIPV